MLLHDDVLLCLHLLGSGLGVGSEHMQAINSCCMTHALPLSPPRNHGLPVVAETTIVLRDSRFTGQQKKVHDDVGKEVSKAIPCLVW
jgi:hypothetical protein